MHHDEPGQPDQTVQLRRGTNQAGVRIYNERLVLSLVRQHGPLAKADIARQTGLSPPTVQTIARSLEADGLLLRQEALRGRIGQPSVPLSLNPDGAFSFGLKIGRRSADLVLMDFVGGVRAARNWTYAYPDPQGLVKRAEEGCRELRSELPVTLRSRIVGLGVATPSELWNWEVEVGARPGSMQDWRTFDLQSAIERFCALPVYLCNDATAACAAELLFGNAARHSEVLYIFVAWFIGGGVVLDGNLFPGRSGYAGSLGQFPVPGPDPDGRPAIVQLLHRASLYVLARRIEEGGGDPTPIWQSPDDWSSLEPFLERWLEQAAEGIAAAVIGAVAVSEFQAAVLDGAFPARVRERLVQLVQQSIDRYDRKGIPPFSLLEGSIGSRARAVGGASLPILAMFMRDRELLFHDRSDARTEGRAAAALSRPSAF
jgi:predicted NBD/HSP70 family sugar kinase